MAEDIKESDWKLFRQLHQVALERFCERVLADVRAATAETGDSYHNRYLRVFDLLRDRDKAIARTFNDSRRSNALILLANIKQEGLITADEFAGFSPEMHEAIAAIEHIRRA